MTFSAQHLLPKIFHLGSIEFLGRLCSIAIVILLGHRYGVVVVGVYALGMTVGYYLQPVIDFGLRHFGARLMARHPKSANEIIQRVQRRRLLMAASVLPVTVVYASLARLPFDLRVWLALFSATGALYALSLDWAAWGREHLHMVGLARAIVPFCILVSIVVGHPSEARVLWCALAGNAAGFLLQAAVFRAWWNRFRPSHGEVIEEPDEIGELLAWGRSSIMGFSIIAVLAFSSIDTLMLGVMSNPEQVGIYSAAYRVLNQVLVSYYLLTSVLYPQFARQPITERTRMLRPWILLSLLGVGIVIATLVTVARGPILTVLFGRQFLTATTLLLLLAWAIPLDFLTSYMSNAYIAWGMEKKILICTTVAAASNVILNLIWIPAYGARAAAVNTLISYLILLISLVVVGRSATELVPEARPQAEMVV